MRCLFKKCNSLLFFGDSSLYGIDRSGVGDRVSKESMKILLVEHKRLSKGLKLRESHSSERVPRKFLLVPMANQSSMARRVSYGE